MSVCCLSQCERTTHLTLERKFQVRHTCVDEPLTNLLALEGGPVLCGCKSGDVVWESCSLFRFPYCCASMTAGPSTSRTAGLLMWESSITETSPACLLSLSGTKERAPSLPTSSIHVRVPGNTAHGDDSTGVTRQPGGRGPRSCCRRVSLSRQSQAIDLHGRITSGKPPDGAPHAPAREGHRRSLQAG